MSLYWLRPWSLVERWARALKVPFSEIYFVPGNHDVDWAVQSMGERDAGNESFRWTQRYDPFTRSANMFMDRMKAASPVASFFDEPYAAIWKSGNFLLAALNSAAHDKPSEPLHYGFAGPESIAWLDSELAKLLVADDELRVFVVHHHPMQFSDPFPKIPELRDFSILVNAQELQLLLRKHRFDLLVHGHKHVPRFETIVISSDHPVHVLGAGSFSVDLGSSYTGSVANQFHLLHIEGRGQSGEPVRGKLWSWAFTGPNGWVPSSETYTGIEHRIGFGPFVSLSSVQTMLLELVKRRRKLGLPIKWSDLQSDDPRLEYLQPRTQMAALRAIAAKERLELAGAPPGEVVLYK
jgi:3',5'-cyclic AMP phosphodiesterase CpdA